MSLSGLKHSFTGKDSMCTKYLLSSVLYMSDNIAIFRLNDNIAIFEFM